MKYNRTNEAYEALNREVYFLGCKKDYETYQEICNHIIIAYSPSVNKSAAIYNAHVITGIDERTLYRITSLEYDSQPSIKVLVKFCVGFNVHFFDALRILDLAQYDVTSVKMRAVFVALQKYCTGGDAPSGDYESVEKVHETIDEALGFLKLCGTKYR